MTDLETFRAETRAWLEANCPAECRGPLENDEDRVWGGRNAVFKTPAHKRWMEIMGERAYLKDDAPGVELSARLEHQYRGLIILTFGGGTNEIQRDLIAVFGLGMPLAPR